MSEINQKEYLKKYLSIGKDSKKKKKKRKIKKEHGLKIIDYDDETITSIVNEDLTGDNEDAPQIVAVIDDRPPSLQIDEKDHSKLWIPVGGDNSVKIEAESLNFKMPPIRIKKEKTESPERVTVKIERESPDREVNARNSKNLIEFCVDEENSNVRVKDERDMSPVRRRDRDKDISPVRRRDRDEDMSPVRRRDEDMSPVRRRDGDLSPLRRDRDRLPVRRKDRDGDMSSKREKDGDISPKRRRDKDSDRSPKRRKKRDNDMSPVRRKDRDRGMSPNRRKNRDISTSERRNRDVSPVRRKDRDRDMSPPRAHSNKPTTNVNDKNEDTSTFGNETKHSNNEENNENPEVTRISLRDMVKPQKKEKPKIDEETKRKYSRWGAGLKQVEDMETKISEELHEMNKPLARYANDEDLDKYLREQEREGDPMLAYLRKKKKKKAVEEGKPSKPTYQGGFMPNRFGIRPGHRWDGVDRSNGYEKRWFEVQNSKMAQIEESYKWSTEDM